MFDKDTQKRCPLSAHDINSPQDDISSHEKVESDSYKESLLQI